MLKSTVLFSWFRFFQRGAEGLLREQEKLRADNEKGVTVDGVHYTGYEAAQMQRRLERAIRAQKRRVLVDEAAGDEEKLARDQTRLAVLRQRYQEFSDRAGLRTREERTEVAGFGEKPISTLVSSTNSGIMESNDSREIPEMAEMPTPVQEPETSSKVTSVDVTEAYSSTATPGQGSITYDDGYDMQRHQAEISFSQLLHKTFGGDIHLLTEVNQDKVNTADYVWHGKLWDLACILTGEPLYCGFPGLYRPVRPLCGIKKSGQPSQGWPLSFVSGCLFLRGPLLRFGLLGLRLSVLQQLRLQ